MSTQPRLPRPHGIAKIFQAVFLALAIAATFSAASAQEQRIVTLVPTDVQTEGSNCKEFTISADNDGKPNCKVRLKFETGSWPTGAKISAMHLLLIGTVAASQTITVTTDGMQVFGENTLQRDYPATKRAAWSATPDFVKGMNAATENPEKAFSLVLTTKSRGVPSEWNRKPPKDQTDNSSFRPRLIIQYTVPGRAPVVQAEGVPGTHSPRKFLPDPGAGAKYVTVEVSSGLWSYAPVFFNGLVYVITNDKQLQALSPLGGKPIWSLSLSDPGQHLLVSESGRLYIVGKDKILVYQLDPSNALKQPMEVKTSEGKPLCKSETKEKETKKETKTDLNPTLAPAVGPDGSLYFVNRSEVCALNPDLQELWKVTLGDIKTSPVSVGPSGKFVYLLARTKGLIAINAQTGDHCLDPQTGDHCLNPLSNQELLNKVDPTLHAPVVIRHPDGTEQIYVAANSLNDGVLAAFNNFKTKPGSEVKGQIVAAENWPSPTGLWSQPIIDQLPPELSDSATPNSAKKIYATRVDVDKKQGTLNAISWLADNVNAVEAKTPTFAVNDASKFLPNSNNLAMDQAGNGLVWNGTTKLYTFKPSEPLVELPTSSSLTANAGLLFGSDGTLYVVDPSASNNRSLRALIPQYTLGAQTSADILSPTHLRVNGTVDKNTTVSAGGSVIVGSEFHVNQGATLKISTGVPEIQTAIK